MIDVEPKNITPQEVYKYIIGGIAPRPIALVSTLSSDGINNLAPFSFFNAFGANPPVVVFGPSRRLRDNTVKDTYNNILATKECVIQVVTHSMIMQMNLASGEYGAEVDEFVVSGFTPVDSDLVKPKRVKESPFQMECSLQQMIPLGTDHGSGNLAVCEVIKFHISEKIFENGIIQPDLIDLVGRNSANLYTRASGDAIIEVVRPGNPKSKEPQKRDKQAEFGIGYDKLPAYLKESNVFTANNLGQFALAQKIPPIDEAVNFVESFEPVNSSKENFYVLRDENDYENMLKSARGFQKENHSESSVFFELTAQSALKKGDFEFAWKVVVFNSTINF